MNVAHFFARQAKAAGDRPAVALGDRVLLDYRELCARACRLAHGLRHRANLSEGARVAIFCRNRPEYVELLLGCWWAGLAPVPVNAKLHPRELAWILENAEASLLFAGPDEAGTISASVPPCVTRTVIVGSPEYDGWFGEEELPLVEVEGDRLAWLFYTSGTTGRPKGAMITHRNLRAMTYAYFVDVARPEPGDAILHAAPMSHGSGLYILPHAAIGGVQVVPESGGFDVAELFSLIARWPGSNLFAAPTMVRRMVDHGSRETPDLDHLSTIVYGGAPMYLADLDAAHACFGYRLAQIYGQGESPMTITALDKRLHADRAHPRWRQRLRSAGLPQIVCRVRTVDAEGRDCEVGAVGEILVRGDSVVPGYWRNPEATRRTMGDGWLRTGDMGCFDEEGFLHIRDRSKDLIISGGANIYPREVEDVLLSHPAVREAAVIGIPDPEWGERVVACLSIAEPVSEAELEAWCLSRMARFKRPRRYVFLSELPKNAYGKILKRELRARLARGSGDPGSSLEQPLE